MSNVFISYRREDSSGHADRLYDRLQDHFGPEHVFMDIDTIETGLDFVEHIEETIAKTAIVLVVIGKSWIAIRNENNERRLDQPEDFVRLEIEAALKKQIRTIPVLVRNATMPKSDQLPETLIKLARLNALE